MTKLPDSSIRGGRQKAAVISGPAEIIHYFEMTIEGSQNLARGNLIHWNKNSILFYLFIFYLIFKKYICTDKEESRCHQRGVHGIQTAKKLPGWSQQSIRRGTFTPMRCDLPTTGNASLSAQAAASMVPAWEKSTVKQPIWPPRNASIGLLGIRQICNSKTLFSCLTATLCYLPMFRLKIWTCIFVCNIDRSSLNPSTNLTRQPAPSQGWRFAV